MAAAQALGAASTQGDVLAAFALECARALGATATALCLVEEGHSDLRTLVAITTGDQVRVDVTDLPQHHPLPVVRAALTGESWFFADRATAVAELPGARELYESSSTEASVVLPLRVEDRSLGAVGLAFDHVRSWGRADRDVVVALGSLAAQAVDRLAAREAERTAVAEVERVLDALRESVTFVAPRDLPPGVDLAVVSRPVARDVGLGGDWADVLRDPAGTTGGEGAAVLVTLGDVVGHDGVAAVAVAQARGALRGAVRAAGGLSPAAVLEAVDGVLSAPDVDVLATAVLFRLRRTRSATPWRLTWTSAGHLPALLRDPDGRVTALAEAGDLLLGLAVQLAPGAAGGSVHDRGPLSRRSDHHCSVRGGSVLLLCSDGLVERRGQDLADRQAQLAHLLSSLEVTSAADVCRTIADQLGNGSEDDVTVLAAVLT